MLMALAVAHPLVGSAADQFGRLPMLFLTAAGSGLAALGIAIFQPGFLGLVGFSILIGGLSHPVYALGIAYVNDRLDPRDFVRAGGTMLVAFCLGTAMGPTLAAAMMSVVGDAGLYLFLAAILGAVAVGTAFASIRQPKFAVTQ
jgi:MFS family permease